jgi:hypothetical protein
LNAKNKGLSAMPESPFLILIILYYGKKGDLLLILLHNSREAVLTREAVREDFYLWNMSEIDKCLQKASIDKVWVA